MGLHKLSGGVDKGKVPAQKAKDKDTADLWRSHSLRDQGYDGVSLKGKGNKGESKFSQD